MKSYAQTIADEAQKKLNLSQENKIKELEQKILELETELYFCYRNKKIEKEVDG